MSRIKTPTRPRIQIVRSAFSMGHGHIYQYQIQLPGTTAKAGSGCVSCNSLESVIEDYYKVLRRFNKKLITRNGTEYFPSEYSNDLKGTTNESNQPIETENSSTL